MTNVSNKQEYKQNRLIMDGKLRKCYYYLNLFPNFFISDFTKPSISLPSI